MLTINEGSPVFVTFDFTDEAGSPIVPSTIRWRVDDISGKTDTERVAWTAVGAPASSVNISVSALNNDILQASRAYENAVVTVQIDLGLATQGTQRKEYRIKNLRGIPGP